MAHMPKIKVNLLMHQPTRTCARLKPFFIISGLAQGGSHLDPSHDQLRHWRAGRTQAVLRTFCRLQQTPGRMGMNVNTQQTFLHDSSFQIQHASLSWQITLNQGKPFPLANAPVVATAGATNWR